MTGEGGQRRAESSGLQSNRCTGSWSAGASGCKTYGAAGRVIGGECLWIVDLANNPSLHKRDILTRWYLYWNLFIIKPGVGVAAVRS